MKVYTVINKNGTVEYTFPNYEEALKYKKARPDIVLFIFEILYSVHIGQIKLIEEDK